MLISEAIERLEAIKESSGDLEIVYVTEFKTATSTHSEKPCKGEFVIMLFDDVAISKDSKAMPNKPDALENNKILKEVI